MAHIKDDDEDDEDLAEPSKSVHQSEGKIVTSIGICSNELVLCLVREPSKRKGRRGSEPAVNPKSRRSSEPDVIKPLPKPTNNAITAAIVEATTAATTPATQTLSEGGAPSVAHHVIDINAP